MRNLAQMTGDETARDLTERQAETLRQLVRQRLRRRSGGSDPEGLTQSELAKRMGGYDQGGLSKFLNGKQGMSHTRAHQICQILGLPEEEVFGARPKDEGLRYAAVEDAVRVMGDRWLTETADALRSMALKHPRQPTVVQLIELGNLIDRQSRNGEVGRPMVAEDDEDLEP